MFQLDQACSFLDRQKKADKFLEKFLLQFPLGESSNIHVVYFDQRLGAAHSKRWSKSSFSAFWLQKTLKKQEFCSKFL